MNRFYSTCLGLGTAVLLAVSAPALACGPEENMTHFGMVAQIDPAAMTLTLTDAETGKAIVFSVRAEQLSGIKVHDRVAVHYSEGENGLVADQITL